MRLKVSTETLTHFRCELCKKWWTIGDIPKDKDTWFCPWCGERLSKSGQDDLVDLKQKNA